MKRGSTQLRKLRSARFKLRKIQKDVRERLDDRNFVLRQLMVYTRRSLEMTQAQLAEEFGRDPSFITKIERGFREASFAEVAIMADIFGMTLSEFWDSYPAVRARNEHIRYLQKQRR